MVVLAYEEKKINMELAEYYALLKAIMERVEAEIIELFEDENE